MNKTNEKFINEINIKFNQNITVIDTYIDKNTELTFHCNIHNVDFVKPPKNILNTTYGCSLCAREHISKNNIKSRGKYGRLIDNFPNIAKQWCYEKNLDVDINNISSKSGKRVWWVCTHCGQPYQSKVSCITNGTQSCICHSCYLKTLPQQKVDSYLKSKGNFGEHYPELLDEWDYELNIDITPTQFTDKSNKKVWWKCKQCGRPWLAKISKRTAGEGCSYCARHTKSNLQVKIENYIRDKYNYEVLNEHDCTLKCYNPQTGYRLLYDNEVVIGDYHLIVECHGQQHYEVCGWSYTQAKQGTCSPEEALQYQQWKDDVKKQFAIKNGYMYLEIPYTLEDSGEYITVIDSEIHKILSLTQQNN